MNLECCENLVTFNEEELKSLNGGTINQVIKKLLPITIYRPAPEPDFPGNY